MSNASDQSIGSLCIHSLILSVIDASPCNNDVASSSVGGVST